LAGEPKYWLIDPKDINMRLPNQILNTVCFLAHDTAEIKYGGTGFIVSIKGAHGNAYLHLVTAKHAAEKLEHGPFVMGVNTKQGKRAQIEAQDAKWWYHPTEPNAVDCAVTLFSPRGYDNLNIEWVHENMFTVPEVMEEAGIGIGDEIAVVGLFTGFPGKQKHFPIVRTGNLAMLPSERIPVKGFDPMEAYLAEGRSIGGLSGSPVFVRQTVNISVKLPDGTILPFAGTGKIFFLGLMVGRWALPDDFGSGVQAEAVNMGVSTICPAHKILEVLYHPELVKMRAKSDEEMTKERNRHGGVAVTDSELEKPRTTLTKVEFEAALKKVSRKLGHSPVSGGK
jgi:hypothetical protein